MLRQLDCGLGWLSYIVDGWLLIVIEYITKELEKIFRRVEMVLKTFFDYNFRSIDFISF